MNKILLEDYLNQNKRDGLVKDFPMINPKSHQLKIRIKKVEEDGDSLVIFCHILWMGSIIKLNHKFIIGSKEIRKIKLINLKG